MLKDIVYWRFSALAAGLVTGLCRESFASRSTAAIITCWLSKKD